MLHLTKKAIKLYQCIMNFYHRKDCLGGYLQEQGSGQFLPLQIFANLNDVRIAGLHFGKRQNY